MEMARTDLDKDRVQGLSFEVSMLLRLRILAEIVKC